MMWTLYSVDNPGHYNPVHSCCSYAFTYPGSGEGECRRGGAMPYNTLCMGNIYQLDITEIYAALLYPL